MSRYQFMERRVHNCLPGFTRGTYLHFHFPRLVKISRSLGSSEFSSTLILPSREAVVIISQAFSFSGSASFSKKKWLAREKVVTFFLYCLTYELHQYVASHGAGGRPRLFLHHESFSVQDHGIPFRGENEARTCLGRNDLRFTERLVRSSLNTGYAYRRVKINNFAVIYKTPFLRQSNGYPRRNAVSFPTRWN